MRKIDNVIFSGNVDNGKKLQLYINGIKDKMYLIEVE